MEKFGTVLTRKSANGLSVAPPSPSVSPRILEQAQRLKAKEWDATELLTRWNISIAPRLIELRHHEAMPTLKTLEVAYGSATPEGWLMARLHALNEYTGSKKMDASQIEWLAEAIMSSYNYLTLGEVDDFLRRVRAGEYGHFYGEVDPMTLASWLNCQYLPLREKELLELECERERKERDEHARRSINFREYCRRKGYPEVESAFALVDYLDELALRQKAEN